MSDKTAHERVAEIIADFDRSSHAIYLHVERSEATAMLAEHQAVLDELDFEKRNAQGLGTALSGAAEREATLREENARLRKGVTELESERDQWRARSNGAESLRVIAEGNAKYLEARVAELSKRIAELERAESQSAPLFDAITPNTGSDAEKQLCDFVNRIIANWKQQATDQKNRADQAEARVRELEKQKEGERRNRVDAINMLEFALQHVPCEEGMFTFPDGQSWEAGSRAIHYTKYLSENVTLKRELTTERQLRQAAESALTEARKERDEALQYRDQKECYERDLNDVCAVLGDEFAEELEADGGPNPAAAVRRLKAELDELRARVIQQVRTALCYLRDYNSDSDHATHAKRLLVNMEHVLADKLTTPSADSQPPWRGYPARTAMDDVMCRDTTALQQPAQPTTDERCGECGHTHKAAEYCGKTLQAGVSNDGHFGFHECACASKRKGEAK